MKTNYFVALGALAALSTILSLPGAILAGVTGIPIFSAVGNVFVIGIMYPFIPLLFKRVGALTLWSIIAGILVIPLPIMGPPGLFLKVIYSGLWGVVGDLTYLIFKRSEKYTAIAVSIVQLAPGVYLATFFWNLLGVPKLAAQYGNYMSAFFVITGIILGTGLGYLSYVIYKKIENTAAVRRIQNM